MGLKVSESAVSGQCFPIGCCSLEWFRKRLVILFVVFLIKDFLFFFLFFFFFFLFLFLFLYLMMLLLISVLLLLLIEVSLDLLGELDSVS